MLAYTDIHISHPYCLVPVQPFNSVGLILGLLGLQRELCHRTLTSRVHGLHLPGSVGQKDVYFLGGLGPSHQWVGCSLHGLLTRFRPPQLWRFGCCLEDVSCARSVEIRRKP